MALLLALSLAATVAAADAAPSSEKVEPTAPEAAPSSAGAEPSDRQSSRKSLAGKIAAELGIMELIFAGLSAVAAAQPEAAGWGIVVLAPLLAAGAPSDERAAAVGFAAGGVGLGLYNALELRSSQYDGAERFWLNLAGWQAVLGCTVLADWIAGPRRTSEAGVSITVGKRGSPSMLLVGGTF